jgi:hypothetical protein
MNTHKILIRRIPVLNAKSVCNDPNAYDHEDDYIEKWWNSRFTAKEIESKLSVKRKKYFSWNFRYDVIMGK